MSVVVAAHSFVAMYGLREPQQHKRSLFMSKWLAEKKRMAASASASASSSAPEQAAGTCQFLLVVNPEREIQHAQMYHSTQAYSPFADEMAALGASFGHRPTFCIKRVDFTEEQGEEELFATENLCVLYEESSTRKATLGDYVRRLTPWIVRNRDAGNETFVVFDDVTPIVNMDLAGDADLQVFLDEWVLKRDELRLSLWLIPEMQYFVTEENRGAMEAQLDVLVLAGRPATYQGLRLWERNYLSAESAAEQKEQMMESLLAEPLAATDATARSSILCWRRVEEEAILSFLDL